MSGTEAEEWRLIYFDSYEISNLGRIRSAIRTHRSWPGMMLKQATNSTGYKKIVLYSKGRIKCRFIHSLVWEAFMGPIPPEKVINHLDYNPANNTLGNLECVTRAENTRHSIHRIERGSKRHLAKLTESDIPKIRALAATMRRRDIAAKFGVTEANICYILRGKTWTHV